VERTGRILLGGTVAALLVAPAAHAQEPVAVDVLRADPSVATAGAAVRLAAPAGAAGYAWDFDGDGTWDAEGPKAQRDHRYLDAGAYSVTVRLTAADGTETVQKVALDVAPSVVAQDEDAAPTAGDDDPAATAGAGDTSATTAPATAGTPRTARRDVVATTAATESVTISDFEFAPATTTVNVGDTVKWTNDGPTGHSATAKDDSFDTGILAKGESATQTFSTAGSFSYICTPHPFMTGTVKVVDAGSGGSGDDSGSTDSGSTGSTGDTSGSTVDDTTGTTDTGSSDTGSGSDSSLPVTGSADLRIVGLAGFLLLIGGLALRRFTRWI
jgi:plastocyanin